MNKWSVCIVLLIILCAPLIAMQKKISQDTIPLREKKVTKPGFERTYKYDSASKRWKLKKEVHTLLRSSGCQEEITKIYAEGPQMVEVEVTSKIKESDEDWMVPGRQERITLADYQELDCRESDL